MLKKVLKWVIVTSFAFLVAVGVWCTAAWFLGWLFKFLFKWECFEPKDYIAFGSVIEVIILFVLLIFSVTVVLILASWGRSRGQVK